MIRIQLSLDERDYALAEKQAKALGLSLAEFVRRAIRNELLIHGRAPWMRYAGMVKSGNRQSSQKIDEVVYGSRR